MANPRLTWPDWLFGTLAILAWACMATASLWAPVLEE